MAPVGLTGGLISHLLRAGDSGISFVFLNGGSCGPTAGSAYAASASKPEVSGMQQAAALTPPRSGAICAADNDHAG